MGGAIAVRLSVLPDVASKILAMVVIDVVEGLCVTVFQCSLQALQWMLLVRWTAF